ncbi:MAG: hypothetical protein SOT36_01915 [Hominisplanchenecus sp.]|nr:hypothetical protein [Hominisplanchenecus sp.]
MAKGDKVPGEGAVYYDIRFYALAPARTGRIRLILNVEAQKSFRPGYEIVTRGIFYGARMISAQLGTEFEHSKYDDIRKVYSVWICMNDEHPAVAGENIRREEGQAGRRVSYRYGIGDGKGVEPNV